MSEQGAEQDRNEAPTPYKLRRARERGQVARGADLGFLAVLVALAVFLLVAGDRAAETLAHAMRKAISVGAAGAGDPEQAAALAGALYRPSIQPVLLLAGTVFAIVLFVEIVQLRGLLFSTHPLKPDFSRLNPAKGLKRLFSARMLKEAAKNVLKFAAYALIVWLAVRAAIEAHGRGGGDAASLASAMREGAMRLLFMFILLAIFFAALDQIMVRREFTKQMRMSRREVTREAREREGEPRLKQKRKQLHAEFATERRNSGDVAGSDLLVINPDHIAVALVYDPARSAAPVVKAKARRFYAQAMKQRAFRLGIPMFEDRPLARALYAECEKGAEINAAHYHAVAGLYTKLRGAAAAASSRT
jgi:flagellar biosynthetic protein FlhB